MSTHYLERGLPCPKIAVIANIARHVASSSNGSDGVVRLLSVNRIKESDFASVLCKIGLGLLADHFDHQGDKIIPLPPLSADSRS